MTRVQPQDSFAVVGRLAKLALDDLQPRIERAVRSLGDPNLVRAQMSKPRIKSPSSLARKARQKGWDPEGTLSRAEDLIGFRAVCHNLQDVQRLANLLEESLRNDHIDVKRRDYVAAPRPSGYRAIHLLFSIPVAINNQAATVGCEIQIRSLLQDAWARLSHGDVYKADDRTTIHRRMNALATLLARADATADAIRNEISRPRRGRRPVGARPLTASVIAFLYRDRFGTDPPDYLVQFVLRETTGATLRSDGLHSALVDENLTAALEGTYRQASGWDVEATRLFPLVIHSLLFGKEASLRRAAQEGRAERKEIEIIARREVLSDLSAEEMLTAIENPHKDEDIESDVERWAAVLGASYGCALCGASIVDPDAFAQAAVKQSKVRGRRAHRLREALSEALTSTAIETGTWDNPALCSNCSYVLSKD